MINFYCSKYKVWSRVALVALALMLAPFLMLSAEAGEKAPKYKKNTVVDFEGALVEGKSRKPYSAYLTQQKESAFVDLNQWQPDIGKSLKDSKERLDKSL
ncbi:MAG: hypothetical protein ACXWQO_19165 [Bdellovibrionota bacterium]